MISNQKLFQSIVSLVEKQTFSYETEEKMIELGFFLTLINDNHLMFQHNNLILRGELVFGYTGRLIKTVIMPSVEIYKEWKSIAKSLPTYQWVSITSIAESISRNTRIMFLRNIFVSAKIAIYNRNVSPI